MMMLMKTSVVLTSAHIRRYMVQLVKALLHATRKWL